MSDPERPEFSPEPDLFAAEMAVQREAIDEIDTELIKLLQKRALVSREVGRIKIKHDKPIYVEEREREVLQKICDINQQGEDSLLLAEDITGVYEAIMKSSRAVQLRLTEDKR